MDYYNELVLQLKLAEYNLEIGIDLEITEARRAKSSEKESNIIGLLKERILPALEYTVSSVAIVMLYLAIDITLWCLTISHQPSEI